jgi:two-component sensor histidine kinase
MEGLETVLESTAAQAVAVVLHELATNASKYGALSDAKGQIRLTWSRSEDGQLALRWTELGGPRVNEPERKGFVGNTTINGGALAPGNSIGLLTVQGSLTFTAAASYMVEVSPSNEQ